MIWIVETKDKIIHEVLNENIGMFIKDNKVLKCQLKK